MVTLDVNVETCGALLEILDSEVDEPFTVAHPSHWLARKVGSSVPGGRTAQSVYRSIDCGQNDDVDTMLE